MSNFESKLLRLEREEIDNLRRLVKETGILSIDGNANDKEFMSQVAAYDDNPIVKAEQTKHIDLVRREGWQIIRENHLAKKIEKVNDILLHTKDRNVQVKAAEELIKQVHQSSTTNDSVLLENEKIQIKLSEVQVDIRAEPLIAPNHMTDSNYDAQVFFGTSGPIIDSEAIIQEDNQIQRQISDSIIDGLDFEGFDIDLGDEYVALDVKNQI